MATLQVEVTPGKEISIIRPRGKIDAETSKVLRAKLDALVAKKPKKIICNLENVDFLASAGYGALIAANEDLGKSGGAILLCSMQKNIKIMYEKMGFSNIFKLFSTEEEAAKS